MGRYQSVADRRRGLVEAAVRVISADGVAKATTRRIAEEAGVSGAIVHYAFQTKDDLFRAVYESLTSRAFSQIGSYVTPGMGLDAGFRGLLDGFVAWLRGDANAVLALMELTSWSLRNPGSRHLASRVYRRHIELTAGLLAEAAPDTDSATLTMLSRLLHMALDGVYLQWRSLGDDSLEVLAPVAADMVLGALHANGGRFDPTPARLIRN